MKTKFIPWEISNGSHYFFECTIEFEIRQEYELFVYMSAVVRPRVGNGPLEAAGRFHGSTTQRYGQNSKPARQSHAANATAYTHRSLAPADHHTLQYKYHQLKYTCEQTLV